MTVIYVVEDDALKASRVRDFLVSQYLNSEISCLGSFNTGLKAILERTPDILILDMTLPTFERSSNSREGRIRPLGGYELLRKLKLRGIVTKAIVVTQLERFGDGASQQTFQEIHMRCEVEFPGIYVAGVYFDQSGLLWQKTLGDILKNIENDNDIQHSNN